MGRGVIVLRGLAAIGSVFAIAVAAVAAFGFMVGMAFAVAFPWVRRRIAASGGVAPEDAPNVGTLAQAPTFQGEPLTVLEGVRDRAQAEIDRRSREALRTLAKAYGSERAIN